MDSRSLVFPAFYVCHDGWWGFWSEMNNIRPLMDMMGVVEGVKKKGRTVRCETVEGGDDVLFRQGEFEYVCYGCTPE